MNPNDKTQNEVEEATAEIQLPDEEEGVHSEKSEDSPAVHDEDYENSPTSDDDTGEMVEEVIGQEPKQGQTIADIVNDAERDRTRPPLPSDSGEES